MQSRGNAKDLHPIGNHTYIHIVGDAFTPFRFWGVTLYTDKEYQAANKTIKEQLRPINQTHAHLLSLHGFRI